MRVRKHLSFQKKGVGVDWTGGVCTVFCFVAAESQRGQPGNPPLEGSPEPCSIISDYILQQAPRLGLLELEGRI